MSKLISLILIINLMSIMFCSCFNNTKPKNTADTFKTKADDVPDKVKKKEKQNNSIEENVNENSGTGIESQNKILEVAREIHCSVKDITNSDLASRFKILNDKYREFYNIYLCGGLEYDKDIKLIHSDNEFHKVTNAIYNSVSSLKSETEKYFTKEQAKKEFYSICFEPTECGCEPRYKDIDSNLYENINLGNIGSALNWNTNTLQIIEVNEEQKTITVEMKTTLYGEPNGENKLTFKIENDVLLLNSSLICV